ncbi:ABC-F family ATP-binding cassette domain-containing protein [Actinoplanes teichomyceticus]|uniref:Macrolide transport system ATP-binding/permease protein n=1 Tax=Actinoplanes teichomyceticus TaxID=1867 RepID=A0A561VR00_ACTTI|nr:ABC-F family ATP-binding cassette domain-containing protein [Actinoplanes teichomyceticus]TWG14032.1 macrolide transport system ATP-binding/permease protein [Actinoplanes teichomyceticus]GIF16766.1 ABC transporter ATPase [Actinoplanes teichomyceticus]
MPVTITLPARAHAQLVASGIRADRARLSDVDLAVSPGSRWGLVGENGRGKTTLLSILSGTLPPDAGTVRRTGTLGVVAQELAFAPGDTVGTLVEAALADSRAALLALDESGRALAAGRPGADAEYARALDAAETLDAWDAERRIDMALAGLNAAADRDRPLATLSAGQRHRVRLACLLGAAHDFLLMDEPTNHLDADGLDFLTDRLRAHPGGVVLVSHDRALLRDVATTILDLDPTVDRKPAVHGDGFAGYRAGRAAALARWEQAYEQQVLAEKRLSGALHEAQERLATGWRPDKGTGRHQRATRAPGLVRSFHRRQDELREHAVTTPEPPARFRMPALPVRPGVTLLAADRVRVGQRLRTPVSLTLESGSRLVVTGANGAGKSTLLAALAGRIQPTSGTVRACDGARTGLLSQESPAPAGRRTELAAFGLLPATELGRPVRELSTGRRRRLDLASLLADEPHVLLLDEPTNHLSIALVDELTQALLETPAAVVVATHDRQLRRDLAGWPELRL